MKPKDLRTKTSEQLQKMLKDIEMNQIKAGSTWGLIKRGKAKPGSLPTSLMKNLRREKARILTILRERELKEGENAI